MKKRIVIDEENTKVVDRGEGNKEIDFVVIKKRKEEVLDKGRTRSSPTKSQYSTGIKQKHIIIKGKKASVGPGPKKKKSY